MSNNETRNTVVVYDSFYEAIKLLSSDVARVKLFNGMMEYGLTGIEPEFDTNELKLSWTFYKPNMDANIKRYAKAVANGKKGGRPTKNPTLIKEESKEINMGHTVTHVKENEVDALEQALLDKMAVRYNQR